MVITEGVFSPGESLEKGPPQNTQINFYCRLAVSEFLGGPQNKGSNIAGENSGAFFVRNFLTQKRDFRGNFVGK